MKKGDLVKIENAAGVISHYGIIVDMIGDAAAFLKVPCKEDRERAPGSHVLLGADYLKSAE